MVITESFEHFYIEQIQTTFIFILAILYLFSQNICTYYDEDVKNAAAADDDDGDDDDDDDDDVGGGDDDDDDNDDDNNYVNDEHDYYEIVLRMYLSISLPPKASPYPLCPSVNQVECFATSLNLQSLRLLYNS